VGGGGRREGRAWDLRRYCIFRRLRACEKQGGGGSCFWGSSGGESRGEEKFMSLSFGGETGPESKESEEVRKYLSIFRLN